MPIRPLGWGVLLAFCVLPLAQPAPAPAQAEDQLSAKRRLFATVGPGLRAIRRDAAGHYYVLTAPGQAVLVFDGEGRQIGEMPRAGGAASAGAKPAAIVYGEDMDVDADGHVYVADRGANLVRAFGPDGTPAFSFPVAGPTSVASLGDGEIAVATAMSPRLVTVFDRRGKVVREFGDPTEVAERTELNRFLNMGRVVTSPKGNLYYAFDYLPEPTVRKYDRHGFAALEIELTALEFQPAAQAARREILRQEKGGAPKFKPVVTAMGVDPEAEEIWLAAEGLLVRFDREGNRRATYRMYTPEGAKLEATAILVERTRLLIGTDPLGVYEFERPGKSD